MNNLAYIDDTRKWTYDDVQKFDDENRYEVIDGKLYMMSSPNTMHQTLIGEIFGQLRDYFKGKTCEAYIAPLDVDFDKKIGKSINFVQPDIFVICDKNKKGKNQILGAPDFIIEIISPSDEGKDRFEKYHLYLSNKVREYWIIDSINKTIDTYILDGDKYEHEEYRITDKVRVSIFNDLVIDISKTYKENAYLLEDDSEEYNSKEQRLEEESAVYEEYKERRITLDEAKERFGITEETIEKIEKRFNVHVEIYSSGRLDCKYKRVIA